MNTQLLVTGASGHLGQRVIHHLLHTLRITPARIIATTRKVETLQALAALGVQVRAADFGNQTSLEAAFSGADRLLLISTDALAQPGLRLTQHQNAVAAAAKVGIKHVAYTSMPIPEHSPLLFAPDHEGTERAIASSHLPGWTLLRNHWYFENLYMSLPKALASGKWYSATGHGKMAHIARDDLARAAATALVKDEGKNTYTLSGEQAFSNEEIAKMVSTTVGKTLEVVHIPLEKLIQGMVASGMPENLATMFASSSTNTAAGRMAEVTGDFKVLTGVAPQPFADWLQANKAAFDA